MWIYENLAWPNFTWDNQMLATKLTQTRHLQGLLIGKMANLGFDLQQESSLNTLTNAVVKSSVIEGESLNPLEVRSSIARRLGIEIANPISAGRDVEGIVEIMLDATQLYNQPLTFERLFAWHSALFPTKRSGMHQIIVGAWRNHNGLMQVVSGPVGRETVHFEAPHASKLEQEIARFLVWFEDESNIDHVLKAGIAHLWFVTLHPFDDGNGRIARAIADLALARADQYCR